MSSRAASQPDQRAPDAPGLDLVVVGLSHRTAPVAVRERAVVRPLELEPALAHLRRHAREAAVLSTCNRTEVYLAGVVGDPVSAFEGAWGHRLREHLYAVPGLAGARHLFRVAAGLDSLVVGETQVLGQMRAAWTSARAAGSTGPVLNRSMQAALAAGKRVHHRTLVSRETLSVSGAAVDLAEGVLGQLDGRTALVLGAGETAELTLRHLRAHGVRDVLVVNRTLARAEDLAGRCGGRAYDLASLREALRQADVVIASSAAPHALVTAALARDAFAQRAGRPVFLIDISMPRVIEPAVGALDGAYLYDLDDLRAVVTRNLAGREAEVPKAEAVIEAELARLEAWARAHAAAPIIRAARDAFGETASRELARSLSSESLRSLDSVQVAALERLVESLASRLSAPLTEAAKDPAVRRALAAALGLSEGDPAPEGAAER